MRFAKCEVRTDHFHRLTADSCSNEIRVASGKSQLSQCNSSKSQILKKTPFLIDINKQERYINNLYISEFILHTELSKLDYMLLE